MNEYTDPIILFSRGEVERQGFELGSAEGVARVVWMTLAMTQARVRAMSRDRPTITDILDLAHMVEPMRNKDGFRQMPVFISEGWKATVDWRSVPEAMESLFEHGGDLTPLEFYVEFELVHPFLDGNGRVGVILYNWLKGTLAKPEVPAPLGPPLIDGADMHLIGSPNDSWGGDRP